MNFKCTQLVFVPLAYLCEEEEYPSGKARLSSFKECAQCGVFECTQS